MKFLTVIIIIVCTVTGNLQAANRKVSGFITGKGGEVLPEATVALKNTNKGVSAGPDGKYHIQIDKPGRYILVARYAGYEPVEKAVCIQGDTVIHFKLKEDVMNLSDIVVTGTRTPKMLKDVPVITRLITSDQIRKLDATTVRDLLETELPGLEFTRSMDGQISINMQGMGGQDMLFLIDGQRLAGETLDNVDYERLNMDNVERIEIVKGAASALYGSNAVGGVVNIITKNASEPWSVTVNGRYGSHNEQRYGITAGTRGNKVSSITNAVYKNMDTYTLDHAPLNLKTVYGNRDWTVSEKFTYTPTDRLRFTLKGGYFHRERDYSRKEKNRYIDYNGSLTTNYIVSDKGDLFISYVYDRYDKLNYYPAARSREKDYGNEQHTAQIQYNHSFSKGNTLTGGAEFFRESLLSKQFKSPDHGQQYGNHSTSLGVVFLQHDISIIPDLNLVYGGRLDYHSKFGAHISPKISAMAKLQPFILRASYGGGFRSPSLKELFTDWDMGGLGMFRIIGNENLRPEKSHNYSFSAEYSRERINVTAMGYCNRIRDKISAVYNTARDSSFYRNVGKATVSGADVHVAVKCPLGIGVKLSYAYVYDRQIYKAYDRGVYKGSFNLSVTRPHSATLRLDYSFDRPKYSLNAALTGRVLSHMYSYSIDADAPEGTLPSRNSYPAYTMWKFIVNQQFKGAITVTAGVDNLFNYKPDVYDFNSPVSSGTTFFAGIAIQIDRLFK